MLKSHNISPPDRPTADCIRRFFRGNTSSRKNIETVLSKFLSSALFLPASIRRPHLKIRDVPKKIRLAACPVGPTAWLLHALFSKSLVERTKIDHDSLVASLADLLFAVACRHFEVNSLSIDADDLGRRAYLVAYWRGGEVLYIHCNTDCAFACVQKRLNGIERRVLHDQNHHGRRKHLRQHGVLESIGKVFG